jgi:hypothetical protein
MNELQLSALAIEAACVLNLRLTENGYGCDSIESFAELADGMAQVICSTDIRDVLGIIEFYEIHSYSFSSP